jgi:hypothetical protein
MDSQRVAEVNLADLDASATQAGKRFARSLEFDRQVTAVIIDAQVLVESEVPGPIITHVPEERDSFAGCFQEAERLWLEAKVEFSARAPSELFDMINTSPEVLARGSRLSIVEFESLE